LRRPAAAQVHEGLLHRGRQKSRLRIGIRGKNIESQHDVRPLQLRRGPKAGAINVDGLQHHGGREVRRECKGQPQGRGNLGTKQTGPQDPQRHLGADPGVGDDALSRGRGPQVSHQLHHVLRKLLRIRSEIAPQSLGSSLVGTRSAAEPEIDSPGKQALERPELLGDHQRRVIRQHDPAGADAYGLGPGGDVADHHRRRRAGNARHAVMLGQPVAPVAPFLRVLGQIERIAQRLRRVAANRHRR
jgi:hypothetical protein